MKLFIGIVLLLAAVAMWNNYTFRLQHLRLAETIVGGISGFLATTTCVNGSPLVLYYINDSGRRRQGGFRGNLTRFFLLSGITAIAISCYTGTMRVGEFCPYAVEAIPAPGLGFVLGESLGVLMPRLSEKCRC